MGKGKYSFPTQLVNAAADEMLRKQTWDFSRGADYSALTVVNVSDEQVKRVIRESREAQAMEAQRKEAQSKVTTYAEAAIKKMYLNGGVTSKDIDDAYRALWPKQDQEQAESNEWEKNYAGYAGNWKKDQYEKQRISLEELQEMYDRLYAEKSIQAALGNLAAEGVLVTHLRVIENDYDAGVTCTKCSKYYGYKKSATGFNPREIAAILVAKHASCSKPVAKPVEVTVPPLRPKRQMEL